VPEYQLVAIDIDGALVNTAGEVTSATRAEIQRVSGLGVTIVIVTGRRYLTARSVAEQLETDVLIAAHNGALLKTMQGEVLHVLKLSESSAQRAVALLFELGHHPLVFEGIQDAAHIWIDRSLQETTATWMQRYLERNAPHLQICDALPAASFGDVLEVVAVIPRTDLEHTMTYLSERLGDSVHLICQVPPRDTRAFLEIAHPGVSKAAPLRYLAAQLGICPAQMIAFGDNYNDLDMLEYAGLPILMENAPEELKRHPYRCAPSHDEDGVATLLRELFPGA